MAEQKEKTERDFLTFDVKFNGLEELGELIKKAKQLVQILKEAQELIDSLSGKKNLEIKIEDTHSGERTEMEINDITEKLTDVIENAAESLRR